MTPITRKTTLQLSLAAAFGTAGTLPSLPAFADDTASVQSVSVTANAPGAAALAPAKASLDAVQPQSVIDRAFIDKNAAAGASYADIIGFTPSVVSINPNGAGLMENQSLTIRGFQDGQYNVTFDGIPWGDSNDFTHHSTVYFMPQDMGGVTVDRGPGQARTIGNATFGGTIAIDSKSIAEHQGATAYASYGSWNTGLIGAEYDSGTDRQAPAGSFMLDGKVLHSDGFLSHSEQQRQNLFGKWVKALDAQTELSFVGMWNHTVQHVPYGSTPAQQQQYGYNFGLVDDPTSQANSGYNYDLLDTDFWYLGLKTRQGDWSVDNKVYTYGYRHGGYNGANTGVVTGTDGGTEVGSTLFPNDVPGQRMHNVYRSIGDIVRVTRPVGADELQFGAWVDHQTDSRFQQEIDWSQDQAPNLLPNGSTSIDWQMTPTLTTVQPYLQYAWRPLDALTLTPGVKYASFRRSLDASVNEKTGTPYEGTHTWDRTLPSIDAHYLLSPDLSVYAQAAKGFLAPNLNVFYNSAPNLDAMKPTSSTNFQVGTNWNSHELTLAADLYHINVANLSSPVACPSTVVGSCYGMSSSVKFTGGELEGTYVLGAGLSVYGNAALNSFSTGDGSVLFNVPKHTGSLGLVYQRGSAYASLIGKYVGNRAGYTATEGESTVTENFGSYTVADLNLSYELPQPLPGTRSLKLGFAIDNLLDRRGNYASFNTDDQGNPLFYVIPTRSYQVKAAIGF